MKILIDLTILADNFSGIERYALNMSLNLIKNNQQEFFLLFKEKVYCDFEKINSANVHKVVVKRCNKLLFNLFRLPRQLNKFHVDCYLFLAFPPPLFFRKQGIVTTIHDLCCWDCPETMTIKSKTYFRACYKSAIKKSKTIITVSNFSKKRIIEKFLCDEQKIKICYSAITKKFDVIELTEEEKEKLKLKYSLPEKFILSLSTIEPRKNLGLLISAYDDLVAEGSDSICDLVLAGRFGWKEKELFSAMGEELKSKVHFIGFVDEDDISKIYNMAQIFVFPSKYEGFGLPPLEAMACGTVVLSSDAASLPEVLGDAAIYFQSQNKEHLKNCIKESLNLENDKKGVLLKKGQARILCYQWHTEADKLLNIIENMQNS